MSYASVMHHALTVYYDGNTALVDELIARREREVRAAALLEATDVAGQFADDGMYADDVEGVLRRMAEEAKP